jgi:hypothetical protein
VHPAPGPSIAGDDLALLSDAEPGGHGARRLGEYRFIARAPTAADAAAPAMEQPQGDAGVAAQRRQRKLGAVQRPVGGHVAAILVAVGIPEHHLLPVSARLQQGAIRGFGKRGVHDVGTTRKVVDGLEQGNDVELRRTGAVQPAFLQQQRDLQQVRYRRAFRNHVVDNGRIAVLHAQARGTIDDGEFRRGAFGIADVG